MARMKFLDHEGKHFQRQLPSREEIRFTDFLRGTALWKLRDFIYRIDVEEIAA